MNRAIYGAAVSLARLEQLAKLEELRRQAGKGGAK